MSIKYFLLHVVFHAALICGVVTFQSVLRFNLANLNAAHGISADRWQPHFGANDHQVQSCTMHTLSPA